MGGERRVTPEDSTTSLLQVISAAERQVPHARVLLAEGVG